MAVKRARQLKRRIHAVAGGLALLTLMTFWGGTVVSELFLSADVVVFVKTAILYGLLLLVPALIVAGASGNALAGRSTAQLPARKRSRMKLIAANGIVILVPCALTLWWMASFSGFDLRFYALQIVELVAGAINLTLLSLQIRDGLRLSGRINKAQPAAAAERGA